MSTAQGQAFLGPKDAVKQRLIPYPPFGTGVVSAGPLQVRTSNLPLHCRHPHAEAKARRQRFGNKRLAAARRLAVPVSRAQHAEFRQAAGNLNFAFRHQSPTVRAAARRVLSMGRTNNGLLGADSAADLRQTTALL